MKQTRFLKHTGSLAGLSAVAMLLLALPRGAVAQESDAVAEGARVYGAMCGRCHNPRSPLERSDGEWVSIINHMRVRANMTGEQVRNVLAFLQATNTNPAERAADAGAAPVPSGQVQTTGAASTDPQVIELGEKLMAQKACLGCHIIGKQGGQVGPTLNGIKNRRDADFLRRKLADPTFDNSTSMMPNFNLSQEDIEALVAFMSTLNGKN